MIAHAFNDVIFKGLLMMSMGAVLHVTGEMRGSELGGLYKKMPRTAILCMVGAASISAFPLFSGFVSKSMVVAAAIHEGHTVVWLALLFAAAGVFHHAGIKVPFFAFFAHDSGIRTREAPLNMLIAMTIAAALCLFIGMQPQYLYAMLPWQMDYWPYDVTHVLAQLQLLFFAALAFVWMEIKGYAPPELHSTNLDIDWFYRKLLPKTGRSIYRASRKLREGFDSVISSSLQGTQTLLRRTRFSDHYLADWPTGSMVMWIAVILGGYLLMDHIL